MNYLTLDKRIFDELSPSELEQFKSTAAGVADENGDYTTQYIGYASPLSGNYNECVIKRVITHNTSGNLNQKFAYLEGQASSLTFNKQWSARTSYTYETFKL